MLSLFLLSLSFLHHSSDLYSFLFTFFVIITLTSAYAFHVYSWTKALDTDLIVGGFLFFPVSCLESRIEAGETL